jgi:hypothetical protein
VQVDRLFDWNAVHVMSRSVARGARVADVTRVPQVAQVTRVGLSALPVRAATVGAGRYADTKNAAKRGFPRRSGCGSWMVGWSYRLSSLA